MNFELTPAQITLCNFADTPTAAPGSKPRKTDDELLQIIAERWRELEYPPTGDDLIPYRATVARRFGGYCKAIRLAAKRYLTEEERERLAWRCPHCDRTGFKTARGLATHERACKEKE